MCDVGIHVSAARTAQIFGPVGDSFHLLRQGTGKAAKLRIASAHELDQAIAAVNRAVRDLAAATVDWPDREPAERERAVAAVVKAGVRLRKAVAKDDAAEQALRRTLEGALLFEAQTDKHVPWAWLYFGDPESPPDVGLFLGHKAVVGYIAPREAVRSNETERDPAWDRFNRAPVDGPIDVNFAEDLRLASASTGAERMIFSGERWRLRALPTLRSEDAAALRKFYDFMAVPHHLAHFNTHAQAAAGGDEASLTVSREFPIGAAQLTGPDVLCEDAVVVLNCCDGMAVSFGIEGCLAIRFSWAGAAVVVGTTSPIEDAYATRFARLFYGHLIEGRSVGHALTLARRAMLTPGESPMCLSYALMGSYATRLVRAGARAG